MSLAGWIDFAAATEDEREAMARILVEAFVELAPAAWPTIDAARAEVEEALGPTGG